MIGIVLLALVLKVSGFAPVVLGTDPAEYLAESYHAQELVASRKDVPTSICDIEDHLFEEDGNYETL